MKTSDEFKKTIAGHLDGVAAQDPLFAEAYKKEGKNLDDCITYILNYVKKSGCVGFADAEIYGLAMHYYDEDNIDIGKPITAKVVVNHTGELSPEDKAQALAEAKKQAIAKLAAAEVEKVQLTDADLAEVTAAARAEALNQALKQKQETLLKKAEKKKPAVAETESQTALF